jgi:mannosyltransferase
VPIAEPASQAAAPAARGAARSRRAVLRRPGWLVAAIPVAAALVVGGYRLGGASLWRDEAYTLAAAGRPSGQIVGLLLHVDAVHGPYYLGMHLVIGLLGSSAAALRLPSLLATSLAAGLTAVLGRRLARMSSLPVPALTGMLAGLLYVAAPQTTWYAQDARPYGLVTLFAVAASYLLVVAIGDGRRRWWAAYAAAIALTGVASLFALLLLAAHGVTLLAARARQRSRPASTARLRPWLAASAAAVVAASPLIVLGYLQDGTLGWVSHPGLDTVGSLVTDFAGSRPLIALGVILAGGGFALRLVTSDRAARDLAAGDRTLPVTDQAGADLAAGDPAAGRPRGDAGRQPSLAAGRPRGDAGRRPAVTVVSVALPWLVLPPLILLAVSVVKPVYVERYVVFGQPALALLCAAGLAWLAGWIAGSPAGRRIPALAWAAPLVILAVAAALLAGPQRAARLTSARPDNLRGVSAVVAANERPGDAVFYLPSEVRVVSMAYPAPFRRLRDLALKAPPVASDTLTGTQVWAPVLARRFTRVPRVWLVQWADQLSVRPDTKIGREELVLLSGMRLVRRWTVQSVVLSLYAVRQ